MTESRLPAAMRVRFVGEFHFTPPEERRVTIFYTPGDKIHTVRRVCGETAIAAGVAVEILESAQNEAPKPNDASQDSAPQHGGQ